jgi:hypothetical protein
MNENEQVPIAEQIELAVDKTLDSAKDIAYARYETFEKQGLVNSPTLEALLFFIDIAFEESALDGRQRIEHAVLETSSRHRTTATSSRNQTGLLHCSFCHTTSQSWRPRRGYARN